MAEKRLKTSRKFSQKMSEKFVNFFLNPTKNCGNSSKKFPKIEKIKLKMSEKRLKTRQKYLQKMTEKLEFEKK